MADVDPVPAVGDVVVDAGELRVARQIDAQHEDEVVRHDVVLEVGARPTDLQEAIELLIGSGVGHRTSSSRTQNPD